MAAPLNDQLNSTNFVASFPFFFFLFVFFLLCCHFYAFPFCYYCFFFLLTCLSAKKPVSITCQQLFHKKPSGIGSKQKKKKSCKIFKNTIDLISIRHLHIFFFYPIFLLVIFSTFTSFSSFFLILQFSASLHCIFTLFVHQNVKLQKKKKNRHIPTKKFKNFSKLFFFSFFLCFCLFK